MSKKRDEQEMIAFRYYEYMNSILDDLRSIDKLIPEESSRVGCLLDSKAQREEMAIIEARKAHLLEYIQVICRDHIIWGKKLTDKGWTPKQAKSKK